MNRFYRTLLLVVASCVLVALPAFADSLNVNVLSRRWHINGQDVKVQGNYAYIADSDYGLRILNISNPASPVEAGRCTFDYSAISVTVNGNYAYVAAGPYMHTINISNPNAPTLASSFVIGSEPRKIIISGNYAIVAINGIPGLKVVNITNPASPLLHSQINIAVSAMDMVIQGSYAYLASGMGGLTIVNISNLNSPTYVSATLPTPMGEWFVGVGVRGNYAYMGGQYSGMKVIDVSNPNMPEYASANLVFGSTPSPKMVVTDPHPTYDDDVYYLRDGKAYVFSANNAASLVQEGFYDGGSSQALGVAVTENYVFLTYQNHTFRMFDRSTFVTMPTQVGSFGFVGAAYGVAMNYPYLYVGDGSAGMRIYNISNPSNPVLLSTYADDFSTMISRKVVLNGNYAYLVDGTNGIRILNVSDPSNPVEEGRLYTSSTSRDVVVQGNLAYVADGGNGLVIWNISNPSTPTFVGYNNSFAGLAVKVSGNYAYVAAGTDLKVVNVAFPSSPGVAATFTNNWITDLDLLGNYLYVTNQEGVVVVNTTTPTSPTQVGFYDEPLGTTGHIVVSGNYAYVAIGKEGLRILNISNPASITAVGYYKPKSTTFGVAVQNNLIALASYQEFGVYQNALVAGAPNPPQNLTISYNLVNGNAVLNWTAPFGTINGYRIYRHSSGHFNVPSTGTLIGTVGSGTTTFTDVGATGERYYRVTAFTN